VVRADLREDHLDDLFLFVVGHDEPIIDARSDPLALSATEAAAGCASSWSRSMMSSFLRET